MNYSQLIAYLNALGVGELDGIKGKLSEAREACLGLERPDLADKLAQAATALDGADMKTYRKRVETVVSTLGHLR